MLLRSIIHVFAHSKNTNIRNVTGFDAKKAFETLKKGKTFNTQNNNRSLISTQNIFYKTPYLSHRRTHTNSVLATFEVDFESRRKYMTDLVNNIPVRFQLDYASDITLISRSTWFLIGKPGVAKTIRVARNASGDIIQLIGEQSCDVFLNNKSFVKICYLTDSSDFNLLWLDWIEELHLF